MGVPGRQKAISPAELAAEEYEIFEKHVNDAIEQIETALRTGSRTLDFSWFGYTPSVIAAACEAYENAGWAVRKIRDTFVFDVKLVPDD